MTSLRKFLIATAIGAGTLALSVGGASAAIVCNGNVCWHAKERYQYPRGAGIVIHEDNWRGGPHIRFREHEGRGYWRGDSWQSW